jgi:hypothetical protein
MKRLLGIIFLLIASLLTLAFLFQIPKLLGAIVRAFSGNASDVGYLIGTVFSWTVAIGMLYILFKYGLKWIKTKSQPAIRNTNVLDEDLINKEEVK